LLSVWAFGNTLSDANGASPLPPPLRNRPRCANRAGGRHRAVSRPVNHGCRPRLDPALQFALEETRVRGAQLLVLYIREVAVPVDMGGKWQDDPQAKALFTRLEAEAQGLKVNKLYSVSDSPADTIIDIAATFGVDTVVLGAAGGLRWSICSKAMSSPELPPTCPSRCTLLSSANGITDRVSTRFRP